MRGYKFEIYKDRAGEWRWRLKAANGKKVGDSGEGYKRAATARRMARMIRNAPIIEVIVSASKKARLAGYARG